MTTSISGWGNYPQIEAHVRKAGTAAAVRDFLLNFDSCIPRGLGRSYGDSSLHANMLSTAKLNRMLSFDDTSGVLSCEAGVSLEEILGTFVPRGWFLPVTPGTKQVTLGGAIASDVHGKNHHKDGSFSEHLLSMDVMTSEGTIVTCSKTINADIFRATCGGMGLTGIILNASFKLKRIETAFIKQTTLRTKDLTETMDLFEKHGNFTYSVAWIDCLAKNARQGRGVVMLGEHAAREDMHNLAIGTDPLVLNKKCAFNVPMRFPNGLLNSVTARSFNFLYYHGTSHAIHESIVDYDSFFYPLDKINNWNRMYGSRGFTQYQCVLPSAVSAQGLHKLLGKIRGGGRGSFLAVLKLFGRNNDNFLSFPMEGYTLALDFPISPGLFTFFNELDKLVLDYGGRLYLSKDVRMDKTMFINSYANAERFKAVKRGIDKTNKFQSLQSTRLGV